MGKAQLIAHATVTTAIKGPLICFGVTALLIDVIETTEFPPAFGQFKNEANRCVFPVVWSVLEKGNRSHSAQRILFAVRRF